MKGKDSCCVTIRNINTKIQNIEKLDNRVIKIIQVQIHSIHLRLIYVLKQQPFGQLKEEQETTKIQTQYRKTFNRFNTEDNCTENITQNAESTAVLQTETGALSGGDSVGFMRSSTGVKKAVRGDLKTVTIIIIIPNKSWYRQSLCKKGNKRKWPVTK
jgi:hypothetical protein